MHTTITPMTRPLCHELYQHFENGPDTFMDITRFAPYEYAPEKADAVLKNKRSQHLMEKVGFVYVREGDTFRYYICKRPQ